MATLTIDTTLIRDAFAAGATAVRDGVLNGCREHLAALPADSPEAAAWREVEAAVAALELPKAPKRKP
jgi:hypothetical protein